MEHLIETTRLVLQPLCETDISFMQELIARPEAYFYDVDMQKSPEDVVKDCQWFIEKLTWGLRPHNPRRAAFVFVRSTGEVNPPCK